MIYRPFGCAIVVASALFLAGCGNRYLSPRTTNPLIEDRVRMGKTGNQKMSVLTSRADRRTILVFGPNSICAEPPPDVAEAVYSQTIAELARRDVSVGYSSTLQTALMQLTRRSQGLDFYRTGAFVNCIARYNNYIDDDEYLTAMQSLLTIANDLTAKEIAHLPSIATAIAQVSNPQTTPNPDTPTPPGKQAASAPSGAGTPASDAKPPSTPSAGADQDPKASSSSPG